MNVDLGDLDALEQMIDRGEWEPLLYVVRHMVYLLHAHPDLNGRALFVPKMDALMQRASLGLVQAPPGPTASSLMIHVATEVYESGGHTRVIEDVVKALPDRRHLLILTDVLEHYSGGRLQMGILRERFADMGLDLIFLQGSSLAAKAQELAAYIAQLAPQAIWLFAHHFDSVANAAVSSRSAPRVIYMHHCDHNPALGATRSDFIHVDLAAACKDACNATYSFPHTFIGMSVKDVGLITPSDDTPLVGATCGHPAKYAGSCEFSYGQMLGTLFSGGVAGMVHIGTMEESQKALIREEIRAMGQDADRICFCSNVPSLADALMVLSPAFYLGSHPVAGGKGVVEALSLGLPILFPCPPSSLPLLCSDMALGNSLAITSLADVPDVIARLQIERKDLARRSREVFDQTYSKQVFRGKLESLLVNDQV